MSCTEEHKDYFDTIHYRIIRPAIAEGVYQYILASGEEVFLDDKGTAKACELLGIHEDQLWTAISDLTELLDKIFVRYAHGADDADIDPHIYVSVPVPTEFDWSEL